MNFIVDYPNNTMDILTLSADDYAILRAALSVAGVVSQSEKNRKAFQLLFAKLDEAAEVAIIYY